MKKDVLISVKSKQEYAGAEPDGIDFITEGRLYKKNDKFYVSYNESIITGLEDTKTTLKLSDGQATILRSGKNKSHMLFIEGKRHTGLYNSEFGAMTISTHTSKISNKITENGGSLSIDYTIEVDNQLKGINNFSLTVTPKSENIGDLI